MRILWQGQNSDVSQFNRFERNVLKSNACVELQRENSL